MRRERADVRAKPVRRPTVCQRRGSSSRGSFSFPDRRADRDDRRRAITFAIHAGTEGTHKASHGYKPSGKRCVQWSRWNARDAIVQHNEEAGFARAIFQARSQIRLPRLRSPSACAPNAARPPLRLRGREATRRDCNGNALPTPTATAECAARVLAPMTKEQRSGGSPRIGRPARRRGSASRQSFGRSVTERRARVESPDPQRRRTGQAIRAAERLEHPFLVAANPEGGSSRRSRSGLSRSRAARSERHRSRRTPIKAQRCGTRALTAGATSLARSSRSGRMAQYQNQPIGFSGAATATMTGDSVGAPLASCVEGRFRHRHLGKPSRLGRVKGNTDSTRPSSTTYHRERRLRRPFRDAVTEEPMSWVALATYRGSIVESRGVSPIVMREMLRALARIQRCDRRGRHRATVAWEITTEDRAGRIPLSRGDMISPEVEQGEREATASRRENRR